MAAERRRQRVKKLTWAFVNHKAGGGRLVKANYRYVKGEGAPPVTHLPEKEAPLGATAEPARMHAITLKE